MAKPALTLRSEKGAALTFAEMDTNLGNLANAVVTVSAGGTTSNIDLNSGFSIADSATITATLAGTVITLEGAATFDPNSPGTIGAATPDQGYFSGLEMSGNIELQNNWLKSGGVTNIWESVYDHGNLGSTITVDATLGSIQTATVTQNFALNTTDLTGFTAGQTVSLILTQATNANVRVMTSNLLYAGGSKTLTTANAAVDTVTITYTGSQYLAALVKGYQ